MIYYYNAGFLVDLERVVRFLPGQTTPQFQRWAHIYGEAKENSLSIVYTDNTGKEKTLDITTPTYDLYNLFFNGLQELVNKLHVHTELTCFFFTSI